MKLLLSLNAIISLVIKIPTTKTDITKNPKIHHQIIKPPPKRKNPPATNNKIINPTINPFFILFREYQYF